MSLLCFSPCFQQVRHSFQKLKQKILDFKNKKTTTNPGVRYLDGGVASGFHHVDPDNVEKKLLHIKGKRNVRVRQVSFFLCCLIFIENSLFPN